jgi:TP901 family phage tail tape measure protein
MGVVAHLAVRISANAADFERQIAGLAGSASKMGAKMQSVGASLTAGLTLPIVGIGTVAVRAGLEFEKAMNQIAGVLRPTTADMDALRAKSLEMGAATMFSATDAGVALLELGKAGFSSKQALAGVSDVLQLAAASGLSMGEAAELSARTLSAFGLKVTDLAHVNDVLASAVNNSTLEIGDLQTAFGYVGPIASSFGMSIEQASAALAIMRDKGIAAETAGRALREGLSRLANPVKSVTDVMGDLGIASFEGSNGQLMGLSQIIGILQDKGITAAQSLKLFGDAAGPGMFALVTQGQAALDGLTTKLQASDGAAKAMGDAMMKGLPGAFEQLKGSVETAFIAISKAIEPVLIPILEQLTRFANFVTNTVVPAFTNLPGPVQGAIVVFAGLVAAIGPIIAVIGTLMTGVGGLVALFPALVGPVATVGATITTLGGAIMAVITGPIGLIAGALAAAFLVWKIWGDDITAVVSGVYTAAKTWLVDMWEGSIFQSIARMLEAIGMLFGALAVKALEGVMGVYTAVKTWIGDKLAPVFNVIKPVIDAMAATFHAAKDKIVGFAQQMYEGVKTWLIDRITSVIASLKGKIDAVTGYFRDMYQAVVGGSYVPDMVKGIGKHFDLLNDLMVIPAKLAATAVEEVFSVLATKVKSIVGDMLEKVGLGVKETASAIGGIGGGGGGGATGGGGGGGFKSTLMTGLGGGLADLGMKWLDKGITALGNKLRGGEEGMYVNPARDTYMSGFQADYGGSQFEALAKAFAESGLAGDVAERHIAMLYKADTMQEFNAATQKINEKLAEGKTAQEKMTAATQFGSEQMTALGINTTVINDAFAGLAVSAQSAAAALAGVAMMRPTVGMVPGGAPAVAAAVPADTSGFAGVESGGGPSVTVNAGTIVGNPDELAMMVLNAVEGGGDPMQMFRQMQNVAWEGA